ncbi:hypothetical protein B296_00019282 [Ensete ventricosum]|uniref:Uncharacterized protein n=1 Tax=Ensete ventricosum TaxID=4639 RepID=A0A426YMG1_ENSVE|nr:hypothetical protein B296_00019282 [Ensete ventricosum]
MWQSQNFLALAATVLAHRQSPLLAVGPCGLAASGCPLRAPCSRPSLRVPRCKQLCPRAAAALAGGRLWASSRALAGSLGCSRLPLQPAWPWVDAPARGLAMADHPYKREIVYPYIPDLVGEDEGSQTSSSLAVSIRWISVVNILQSNLATLA